MDQLRFTGLHEDGAHLVVTAADGTDFIVAADERLRAALRQSGAPAGPRTTAATPREVQTHIRAGLSAQEVAESTGWTVERIARYEGPILAERAHVARLGSACVVRTHDRSGPAPTLEARVRDRLQARGVNTDHITWDSKRPQGGQWSVQVRFMAGQRVRHASWSFDVASRSVEAIDDEARWLSEDEQSLPTSAPAAAVFGSGMDAPDDLISSMRERSRRRGQAGGRRRKSGPAASDTDGSSAVPIQGDQELPLPDLPAPLGSNNAPSPAASVSDDLDAVEATDGADRVDATGEDATQEDADRVEESGQEEATFGAADTLDGDLSDQDPDDSEEGGSHHTSVGDFFDLGSDDDEQDEASDEAVEPHVDDTPAAGTQGTTDAKPSTPSRGRKGRQSVPSWDDIMFGARDRKS